MATLTDLSDGIQLDINLEIPPPGEWLQLMEVSPTTVPILLTPPSLQGPLLEHIEIVPENIIIHEASTPKVEDLEVGTIVKTPDSHPEDFKNVEGKDVNKETGEIWTRTRGGESKAHRGEKWKVFPKGTRSFKPSPRRRNVGSDGEIKPGN